MWKIQELLYGFAPRKRGRREFYGSCGGSVPWEKGIPDPRCSGTFPMQDYSRESRESKRKIWVFKKLGKTRGILVGGDLKDRGIPSTPWFFHTAGGQSHGTRDSLRTDPGCSRCTSATSRRLPGIPLPIIPSFHAGIHRNSPFQSCSIPEIPSRRDPTIPEQPFPAHPEGKADPTWNHPKGLSHHALPSLPLLFHPQQDFWEELGCWRVGWINQVGKTRDSAKKIPKYPILVPGKKPPAPSPPFPSPGFLSFTSNRFHPIFFPSCVFPALFPLGFFNSNLENSG